LSRTPVSVSVVVPVRDDPFVDDLIASLVSQRDCPTHEILVAFDGGRGPSRRFREGPLLRGLRLPPRGPYVARNAAAREARGEILLFTDSDCVCPPDWIARAVHAFEDAGTLVLQGSSMALVNSRLSRWMQEEHERWVAGHAARSYRRMCNTRCFGIRRDVFAALPFLESHVRGGDGAYGIELERRAIPIRYEPSWSLRHRHPESPLVFARRVFDQGRNGVFWKRTHGIELFGPAGESDGRTARLARRAARYPVFGRAASGAAVGASAALALATAALPYRAGRPVFAGLVRAARLAGRLFGEAESGMTEPVASELTLSGPAVSESVSSEAAISQPDVSIVLETENAGPGHRLGFVDVLRGIAAQTRLDRVLEVLVVTGSASDSFRSEAAHVPIPLRWLERPGLRYYDLKNAGIAESRGRYVVLADSDAVFAPDFVERGLAAFERCEQSVAAITGRTRYQPGPFALELALAQLPNQEDRPGDTTHFLAHNVMFRGDLLRATGFRGGHIRLCPDTDLASRLIELGHRIRYDPELRVTHNYARSWRELARHCAVIGYHDARFRAWVGARVPGAAYDALGRFRVLAGRLARLRRSLGISAARVPLSLTFLAAYSMGVARGYAAFLRNEPEPFAEF
jgi:glycosyltransferase involved in cell wall biosynthesis